MNRSQACVIAAPGGPAHVLLTDTTAEHIPGCNMAFRLPTARAAGVEFDEALPLYGWLEDVDFSRRMAPYGKIISWPNCRGVHMAVKRGRTSGVKLGYSQVMNPFYLWRKRTMGERLE